MRREEIMLRGYHIWLGSNLNTVSGIGLDFLPFNDLIQEFYEVVWLVGHETATKMVMERDRRKWIEMESEPLHGVFVPPSLKKRWEKSARMKFQRMGDE